MLAELFTHKVWGSIEGKVRHEKGRRHLAGLRVAVPLRTFLTGGIYIPWLAEIDIDSPTIYITPMLRGFGLLAGGSVDKFDVTEPKGDLSHQLRI